MTVRAPVISVDLETLERDPYPVYEAIRAVGGTAWIESIGAWYVVGYDDVRSILEDPGHFAVGTDQSLIRDLFGDTMLTLDGPPQQRLRGRFQGSFAPSAVRDGMTGAIEAVTGDVIAAFAGRREIDLRADFAARLPILSMLDFFGIDRAAERELRLWYDDFEAAIANLSGDMSVRDHGRCSAKAFRAFFTEQIAQARQKPRPGLLATALQWPQDQALEDEEIINNAMLIFFGGISTVEALLLNTLYAATLHECPLTDATIVAGAIDETMRWLSPAQSATRHVVSATPRFAIGDTVSAMLAAANRDPAIFAEPAQWNPGRRNAARHLGFAAGPHFCPGNHLAKLEVSVAIRKLLGRFPDMTIPDVNIVPIIGAEFRQPRQLIATLGKVE